MEPLRYIRRTPLFNKSDDVYVAHAKEVEWLSCFKDEMFFQIPANYSLHSDILYKAGKIIGIDAASAATVWALQLEQGMTCIDTCCAPGIKLCLIQDCIGEYGTLVGLDVNEQRLDVCYNLLKKFGYQKCIRNIYKVCLGWTVETNNETELLENFRMQRKNGSRKFRIKKQKLNNESVSSPLEKAYERVLVDVQCTHDGSERHVEKHEGETGFWRKHGKPGKAREHYDTEEKIEALIQMQQQLILNGFNLLSPGGLMVYSTCSLQPAQNQEVVEYLFARTGGKAIPGSLPFKLLGENDSNLPSVPATRVNDYSCLFDPDISGTSGQYIAVIRKISID